MNLSHISKRNSLCSLRIVKVYVRSGYGTMMSLSLMKRRAIRYERCNTCVRRCKRSRVRAHRRPTRYATSLQVTWGQPVMELIRRFASAAHVARDSDINRSSYAPGWTRERPVFFIKKRGKKEKDLTSSSLFSLPRFSCSRYQTKSLTKNKPLNFSYTWQYFLKKYFL